MSQTLFHRGSIHTVPGPSPPLRTAGTKDFQLIKIKPFLSHILSSHSYCCTTASRAIFHPLLFAVFLANHVSWQCQIAQQHNRCVDQFSLLQTFAQTSQKANVVQTQGPSCFFNMFLSLLPLPVCKSPYPLILPSTVSTWPHTIS